MAKKGILKDLNGIEILPLTRGELVLDSSGKLAFHSNEFLATASLPGLMSADDKKKLAGIIIDDALSTTSTNPVLNKVVTNEINSIKKEYLKSASVNGNTLTIVDLSDSEIEFKNTTYDTFLKETAVNSGGRNGLVPKPTYNNGSTTRFLKEDGTWAIPNNTTYTFASGTDGSFTVTPLGGSNQKVTIGKPATAGIADKVAKALTIKVKSGSTEGTDIYTYDGSEAKTLDIKAGDNITLIPTSGVLTIAATNSNTTYTLSGVLNNNTFVTTLTPSSGTATTAVIPAMVGATSSAAGKAGLVPAPAAGKNLSFLKGDGTWAIPADTKVTSVENHYTPTTDTNATLGATANSTTSASWGSTDLVTGVTIQRDAKGHVTGISVNSILMPANPNIDTKVTLTVTTSNASYPLLLAPSGLTATTTTTSYFDSGVTLNPSTNTIEANVSGNSGTTNRFKNITVASGGDLNTALIGGGLARNYSNHSNSYWKNSPSDMYYGCVLELSSNGTSSLSGQLAWDVNHNSSTDTTKDLYWRAADANGFTNSVWHKIAYIDDIPTSLKNPYALTVFGVSYDGSSAKTITANTMIGTLSEGSADVTDGTEILTSYASDNGFADTNALNTLYKRDASKFYNYIKTKLKGEFPGLQKTGTVTSVTVTGANGLSGTGTVTTSGTITLSNAGVRSTTINGNYLRVNTNGTNEDLTIPYATIAKQDVDGNAIKTTYLRKVTVANNTVNDFNTFESMTLTGRGDPKTGASLSNAPWTGSGPAGGYGVLTYLWAGYGTQMAWGYNSNRIYIRNRYYNGSSAVWRSTWDYLALSSDIPTVTNYYWANIKISASSNSATSPTFATATATNFGVNSTAGTGLGISLYDGSGNVANYGIAFVKTANWGTHGYVTYDWATYFTMSNNDNRGWIFRRSGSGNVFSIDTSGLVYANGRINGNYYTSRVADGTLPYACTSTTLNDNLNADLLDGYHGSRYTRALGGPNCINITVGGDAATYYPVVISAVSNYYPMLFVNISRTYNETAPNSWNTSTHKGGLTLTLLWNGSSYWDGNGSGSPCYVVYVYQSYCTMVGGFGNSTGGKVVWLRGGGAVYHIHAMNGTSVSATVYTSTYTDSASLSFAPRTTVDSYTVRWPGYALGADKLGSSTLGGTYQPIYLNGGTATTCSSYAKAIKSITRNGTTFTYTCIDGTTDTFTLLDTNTTYSFTAKGSATQGIYLSATNTFTAMTYSLKATVNAGTISTLAYYSGANAISAYTNTMGGTTKPIYLAAGVPTAGSTYAGGTAITLNGTSKAASTASFYAPTTAGTSGQFLQSTGGVPSWTNRLSKTYPGIIWCGYLSRSYNSTTWEASQLGGPATLSFTYANAATYKYLQVAFTGYTTCGAFCSTIAFYDGYRKTAYNSTETVGRSSGMGDYQTFCSGSNVYIKKFSLLNGENDSWKNNGLYFANTNDDNKPVIEFYLMVIGY